MEIDYKAGGFWLSVLQWVWIGVLTVWGYLRTKDSDNARAVAKVAVELAQFIKANNEANEQQNIRLTTLEEAYKHMPTDDEVAKLSSELATVAARVDGLTNMVERVERQTSLIHEHLLRSK